MGRSTAEITENAEKNKIKKDKSLYALSSWSSFSYRAKPKRVVPD